MVSIWLGSIKGMIGRSFGSWWWLPLVGECCGSTN